MAWWEDKEIKVGFLNKDVENQIEEFNNSSFKAIYHKIQEIKKLLKDNPEMGRNVKKKLIPKKYRGFSNLNIINLPDGYRLLYTIGGSNDIEIVGVLLVDCLSHPDYDTLFNF
ncbi:hypothetical protein COT72_03900 [archaeon CG10_big_fil_rev_8_21_14_0_10_43_11]|nr:MAG: hypothetical protein COT72_03900 [archaeon CG10_big_fil_rev_8_21_14_0_10_43_11]